MLLSARRASVGHERNYSAEAGLVRKCSTETGAWIESHLSYQVGSSTKNSTGGRKQTTVWREDRPEGSDLAGHSLISLVVCSE